LQCHCTTVFYNSLNLHHTSLTQSHFCSLSTTSPLTIFSFLLFPLPSTTALCLLPQTHPHSQIHVIL
jgi:hypothetical protein